MKSIEHLLEVLIFNSRWLLAPFYLGLVAGILILLIKFGQEFFHLIPHALSGPESEIILAILTLADMSLVANLLIIIVFSGYENFVSKIDTAGHEDRPDWMGKVDFSGLKIKVMASIVAISAIELLKAFVNVSSLGNPGVGRLRTRRSPGKLAFIFCWWSRACYLRSWTGLLKARPNTATGINMLARILTKTSEIHHGMAY